MDKPVVLIVDDTMENTHLMAETLAAFDYSTLIAASGQQALDIVAKTPNLDLILLDIMMPEMDGFEVCRRLKADSDTKDIPIIFMSALNDSKNIVTGLQVGGVDYISKPFNVLEVIARVKTHVTLMQQHKQLKRQYAEIEELQQTIRKYISKNTWLNIKAEISEDSDTDIIREYDIMTIMFTDIAGFTTISEQVEPRLLIHNLTEYMELVSSIIHKHHGQVDKFLGDGLFAFFDSAPDAQNAAFEIQTALLSFNRDLNENDQQGFLTRIGLATGAILQAIFGFDERLEHTLIGDRVNTAARLQSEAELGGILMDELTYLAVGQPETAIEKSFDLKGKINSELAYAISPEVIEIAQKTS